MGVEKKNGFQIANDSFDWQRDLLVYRYNVRYFIFE